MHSWETGRRAAQHARVVGSAIIDVEGRVRPRRVEEHTTEFYVVFANPNHNEVLPPTVFLSRVCANGMGSNSSMFRCSTIITADH
jgi:hypothetical protein